MGYECKWTAAYLWVHNRLAKIKPLVTPQNMQIPHQGTWAPLSLSSGIVLLELWCTGTRYIVEHKCNEAWIWTEHRGLIWETKCSLTFLTLMKEKTTYNFENADWLTFLSIIKKESKPQYTPKYPTPGIKYQISTTWNQQPKLLFGVEQISPKTWASCLS